MCVPISKKIDQKNVSTRVNLTLRFIYKSYKTISIIIYLGTLDLFWHLTELLLKLVIFASFFVRKYIFWNQSKTDFFWNLSSWNMFKKIL